MGNDQPTLRAWEFAGLMITYWCNARCAFCYVHSSPSQGGRMAPADAVRWRRQLDRIAATVGKPCRVHIGGGEPFGDFEHLCAVLRAVQADGLGPVEKVETNAFWATDDRIVADRLATLRQLGVDALTVSTDWYHQQFVPIDRVRRCVRIAGDVFGEDGVLLRWPEEIDVPSCDGRSGIGGQAASGTQSFAGVQTGEVGSDRADVRAGVAWPSETPPCPSPSDASWVEAVRAAYGRHRDRLTGRAAFEVAPLLDRRPADAFAGQRCKQAMLKSKHVHIDPDGYVLVGVCSGIVIGNARVEPLDVMWARLADRWADNPVIARLVRGGPVALMGAAVEGAYVPLEGGYASKCHLCTHVRQWLYDHGVWPDHLGPSACYLADAGACFDVS